MEEIQYIGEHLWVGQLGHFLILLGFVSVLFSSFSYFNFQKSEDKNWLNLGRIGYTIHGISMLTVIGLIFYAMVNKMYEYSYVYRTVSDHLPMEYTLAAFWADQEGSFMLWMFWHIILGWILISAAKKWEAPVLTTLCLIQAFIGSMLLGLYLPFGEDIKIGSSPFILIRDVFEGPIFSNADYLSLVVGKGLNPLLQNYWMTIHPPVLFLGFASLSIPFCYAVSGLSNGAHKVLMQDVKPWALFSAFIFGLGILMGSAWAYEALTFGGYWAWDPVENSSLVPWLLLMAGVHTNLIANKTGYSIKSTYIYYLLGFIFVIYSTFLTRSGILGETSVHAFTTMGLETQLIAFIVFAVGLGLIKFLIAHKSIPVKEKEEEFFSREFWMFIGALVFLFSGLLMTVSTSLPVFNKIMEVWDPNYIGKVIEDQVEHHNRFQIWIGVFMGLLSGLSILLRYKSLNWDVYKSKLLKHLGTVTIVSLLMSFAISSTLVLPTWQHNTFLFAGLFTLFCNLDYVFFYLKGRLSLAGASLSHLGFGLLVIGILYTGLNKKTISTNPFVQEDFLTQESAKKAIILIKGEPFFTSKYWINYVGDTLVGNLRKYQLDFREVDIENNTVDKFTTYPSAIYSSDFSKIEAINPGTEHNIVYDVFTQASPPPHLQDIENAKMVEDSLFYLSHMLYPGDSFEEENYTVDVGNMIFNYDFDQSQHGSVEEYDMTIALPLTITNKRNNKKHIAYPGLALKDALIFQFPDIIDELGIKIKLNENTFNEVFTEDSKLSYENVKLKVGETINYKSHKIKLTGFDQNPTHTNYEPQEKDIALSGKLEIINNDGRIFQMAPLYIIQNLQPFSIKDYNAQQGFHARFSHIDPSSGTMTFSFALDDRFSKPIEVFIAGDVPRSDILIVQADIFPGINLVWSGCLLMLFGILLSLMARKKTE